MRLASAETRLVMLCVREPEALAPGALQAAAAAVRDWDAVVATARRHWVSGYVRRAAAREGLALPPGIDEALRQDVMARAFVVLQLTALFRRVLAGLQQAGVPVLVIKGPTLATTVYPEVALRPYSDVDVVVEPRHEATAEAILNACGLVDFAPSAAAAGRTRAAAWLDELVPFERSFQMPGELLGVELHFDPLLLFLRPADEAACWRRAVPLPGLPGALMLGVEDQLIQLTVHAHRHGFDRLLWLKDLDLLLRVCGARFDWDLVLRTARQEGVTVSLWYALRLATALLGTPVPAAALARLGPPAFVQPLYDLVWPLNVLGRCPVFFDHQPLRVARRLHWSLSGPLTSVVFYGRRRERARAWLRIFRARDRIGARTLPDLVPNYFGSPGQWKTVARDALAHAAAWPTRSSRGRSRPS